MRWFALSVLLVIAGSSDAQMLRVVALTGEAVPGSPGSVTYFSPLMGPTINDAGEVSFRAILGGSRFGDRAIWSEGAMTDRLVAAQGDVAPGGPNIFFSLGFSVPSLDANGDNAFRGNLTGAGASGASEGIWVENGLTLELAARRGSPAPGGPAGALFLDFDVPSSSDTGELAFAGEMEQGPGGVSGNDSNGLWLGAPAMLDLVARQADPAPGSAGTFATFGPITLTASGRLVFGATLSGVPLGEDTGIWTTTPTAPTALVARGGQAATGTSGLFQSIFVSPAIAANDSGQVAFGASIQLDPPDIVLTNASGVWAGSSSGLRLVARRGSPAPGTSEVFGNLFASVVVVDENGLAAFRGALEGFPLSAGIWAETAPGVLSPVVVEGDPAPGAPPGAVFETLLDLVATPTGQLAFLASLEVGPGGVTSSDSIGMWAQDASGALTLVVRQQDSITLSPSDSERVLSIKALSGAQGGNVSPAPSFNRNGDLVFAVVLADGRDAILVARVPEAGATLAQLVAFACLFAMRWQRKPR